MLQLIITVDSDFENRPERQPETLNLLVLVPHRDARLPLREWSASLFSSGMPGAWSFPWVAPLAALSRPLSEEELKSLAHNLRRQIHGNSGKFSAGPPTTVQISSGNGVLCSVLGLVLNIEGGPTLPGFLDSTMKTVIRPLLPTVIGAAVQYGPLTAKLSGAPQISFKAAALANMSFCPLVSPKGKHNAYSFKWQIGALHWLPKNDKV